MLFFFSVFKTISTGLKSVRSIELLSDTTAAICGEVGEARVRKVKTFSLETDTEISCIDKDTMGLAAVPLENETPTLAVSGR